jgi:hypothetical protein
MLHTLFGGHPAVRTANTASFCCGVPMSICATQRPLASGFTGSDTSQVEVPGGTLLGLATA